MREVIFHGKMPDPFLKPDGTRVTPQEWPEYKKALRDMIVDIGFGGMPPRPEVVELEFLNKFRRAEPGHETSNWLRIHAGTKEKQISFCLELCVPYVEGVSPEDINQDLMPEEKYPVILTGDGCYYNMEYDVIVEANKRGFIAAKFNGLEIANDSGSVRNQGAIYDLYPGDYSAISAWAWGYMVCMDVFEKLSFTDETEVAITGHSRGGKTVMLAAAVDERIKYVCPNNSGCHGANSYRCEVPVQEGVPRRTETIKDTLTNLNSWTGLKLEAYRNCVEELPYDNHYFGALIAPRYYLQCEGMQDYWINPIGAWQNFMAVKECYKYLGCEDHAGAWFRPGYHRHKLPDYAEFLDFIVRSRDGLPLREHLQINPYPDVPKNFNW